MTLFLCPFPPTGCCGQGWGLLICTSWGELGLGHSRRRHHSVEGAELAQHRSHDHARAAGYGTHPARAEQCHADAVQGPISSRSPHWYLSMRPRLCHLFPLAPCTNGEQRGAGLHPPAPPAQLWAPGCWCWTTVGPWVPVLGHTALQELWHPRSLGSPGM